jgi:hypothetical protein
VMRSKETVGATKRNQFESSYSTSSRFDCIFIMVKPNIIFWGTLNYCVYVLNVLTEIYPVVSTINVSSYCSLEKIIQAVP